MRGFNCQIITICYSNEILYQIPIYRIKSWPYTTRKILDRPSDCVCRVCLTSDYARIYFAFSVIRRRQLQIWFERWRPGGSVQVYLEWIREKVLFHWDIYTHPREDKNSLSQTLQTSSTFWIEWLGVAHTQWPRVKEKVSYLIKCNVKSETLSFELSFNGRKCVRFLQCFKHSPQYWNSSLSAIQEEIFCFIGTLKILLYVTHRKVKHQIHVLSNMHSRAYTHTQLRDLHVYVCHGVYVDSQLIQSSTLQRYSLKDSKMKVENIQIYEWMCT